MFPFSIWRIVLAEFMFYIFANLGLHVYTDDENVEFRDAAYRGG